MIGKEWYLNVNKKKENLSEAEQIICPSGGRFYYFSTWKSVLWSIKGP